MMNNTCNFIDLKGFINLMLLKKYVITSCNPRSAPPYTLIKHPLAPFIEVSSNKGLFSAELAAIFALPLPSDSPMK